MYSDKNRFCQYIMILASCQVFLALFRYNIISAIEEVK